MSTHGYLPGDLFEELYFFAVLTIVYLILFVLYATAMHCHRDSIIDIQKWILWTILIGFCEVFFRSGDYFIWNEEGTRAWYTMYTGEIEP